MRALVFRKLASQPQGGLQLLVRQTLASQKVRQIRRGQDQAGGVGKAKQRAGEVVGGATVSDTPPIVKCRLAPTPTLTAAQAARRQLQVRAANGVGVHEEPCSLLEWISEELAQVRVLAAADAGAPECGE